MKWALLIGLLVGCPERAPNPKVEGPLASEPSEPTALHKRADISLDEFAELHAEGGITLIDVRTNGEFAEGHIPGAINLPVERVHLENPIIASLDKSQPVYFVCAVGGRSSTAADRMAAAGFQAVNVDGGTNGWVGMGLAVDR
jgi:rhodanese-related sulfurtransferase